jgi:hypothetical protein
MIHMFRMPGVPALLWLLLLLCRAKPSSANIITPPICNFQPRAKKFKCLYMRVQKSLTSAAARLNHACSKPKPENCKYSLMLCAGSWIELCQSAVNSEGNKSNKDCEIHRLSLISHFLGVPILQSKPRILKLKIISLMRESSFEFL